MDLLGKWVPLDRQGTRVVKLEVISVEVGQRSDVRRDTIRKERGGARRGAEGCDERWWEEIGNSAVRRNQLSTVKVHFPGCGVGSRAQRPWAISDVPPERLYRTRKRDGVCFTLDIFSV